MTTPFHDLQDYLSLPRVGSVVLSPDGARLAAAVSVLNAKRTGYTTAWWQIDPSGVEPARRLTRGSEGEGGAAFTREGDLLFLARRPGESGDDAVAALHRLPAGGGEAHVLATRPAGISGVLAASEGESVVVSASTLLSATDEASERALRGARKDNAVSAILHAGYPVRFWDHDLGPAHPRLFAVEGEVDESAGESSSADGSDSAPEATRQQLVAAQLEAESDRRRGTRDLTPDAGRALDEGGVTLSPDGSTIVATWRHAEGVGLSAHLVRIDVESGRRTVLVREDDAELSDPTISPDGRRVAYLRHQVTDENTPPVVTAWVVDLAGGRPVAVVPQWDRWPSAVAWVPGSDDLLLVADDHGHSPVFRAALEDAEPVRLTGTGAYSSVRVAPDGLSAYAVRSSYLSPGEVVRLALIGAGGQGGSGITDHGDDSLVTVLRAPAERPALPGRLEDVAVQVTDPDGSEVTVRAFLAMPEQASPDVPAPLLLWVHGGPIGSWNAWSWRWNPWLMVAQGYAVLLPDPALSTGYGEAFLARGWGRWGEAPYTDLMAITDAVEARSDIDATRTAAMGGSFGGYMANWIAGHTDRFRAIVTHASLWALDQFGPTTDASFYWAREMTPEQAEANSPHRFVEQITTPMLVIHGDKDYRVPIGEGLRLWYELLSASGLPAEADGSTVHRFLYYPDENHWILSPQHAAVWYQVVLAFLSEHVMGVPQELPDTLG